MNAPSRPKIKPGHDLAGKFSENPAREYNIAAVDRTLDLLDALSRIGPASLAALAEDAGCTRTAAFRLLRTLQARGFTIQDEARGLWRLGARWNALSRAASEQGALAATAMPFLAALGKATGENVYLRVRDGMESETVAIYQTDPAIRMYSEVGRRGPLHAGSSRILLAFAPEAVQTQLLAQRLNRFTPATRIDPTWVAADLQRIRTRNYLITSDEVVAGAVGIGAPVRDATGSVIAVLHISTPSMRMRPPRPRTVLPLVMDAAAKLSQALGAAGKPEAAGLLRDETAPTGWTMSGGMLAQSRPHTIFR
ncbi:MAG TPA: IclR family transcriptional regulator [Rhodopila sp.]|nr:IclR family transcriptional regulator [Rhodopila sp.]